jgi:hypothetical protein
MRNQRCLLPVFAVSLLFGAFGLVSAACSNSSGSGGSGAGGAVNDCFDYTSFNGMTPAAHFKADVLPIFRLSCGLSMACHGNPNPSVPGARFYGPSKSDPDPTAAEITMILSGIVGTSSVDEPDMDVIKAGDPAHSFMMYKLDAANDPMNPDPNSVNCSKLTCSSMMTCLVAMPSGGPQLPAAERDTIRRWIAQGAMND